MDIPLAQELQVMVVSRKRRLNIMPLAHVRHQSPRPLNDDALQFFLTGPIYIYIEYRVCVCFKSMGALWVAHTLRLTCCYCWLIVEVVVVVPSFHPSLVISIININATDSTRCGR